MLFAHESLRRSLLVGLLAAGGVGSAWAAPADQDYESEGWGTYLGNPVTINGITYSNNDTIGIIIVRDGAIASVLDQALAFRSSDINASTEVGFKTGDGSEFKLNSFEVGTGYGQTALTIKGYRDGSEVASATSDFTNTFGTFDVAANTAWQNIDEVRITGADLDIDIDDLDFSPAVVANTAPVIGNLGGSVAWPNPWDIVTLDVGGNATATDTQLGALNGGQGNWDGAVLRVRRKTNAVPDDNFGMNLPASYGGGGGQITHDGVTIANYSISGGTLTVTFTDVAKPVLTSYVNDVLRSVEYSNSQPAGDAVIEFSLSDGTLSGTAEVTVTSDVIYVTNATDTAVINPVNGTSFSEAVAIANADSTGSQEIRFLSGFGNSTLTVNAVTVSGDVTVDFNNVNNLTLDGGNITISAGTTLTVARDVGNIAAIQNVITGAGNLAKTGTSRVTLSGVSTYTGGTTISNGELRVRGSLRETSSLTVASGGYLSGTGSVFFAGSSRTATFQSGSFLIPGDNGTGVLTIFGNLSMAAGSTLWVEIQGTVPGTSYDQLAVFGAVNVTGATLTVDHDYTAAPGDSHTIIANDQMDSIAGAFTGLAEGGTLTANGTVLTASYTGGTGNDFTLAVPAAPANTAPVIGNLDGDSRNWQTGNLALDAGIVATVSDAELGALNSGNGNWAGASLTVRRQGTALSTDVFGFDTTGNPFTVNGANLQAGGLTFATFTNANGVLTVNFTSSGAPATTALVQNVLRRITYRNDTPAGDATIRFTLADGLASTTADVTVYSDTIYITTATDTSVVDLTNGVSFSEAVAIAAADATGSQTLVITNALSVPINLAGSLSINESLTLDTANVGGMSISGGTTITLGSGTTLRIKHESGSLTINSTLAGTGSLRKEGGGTLALGSVSNEANMSGGITVAGGTLQVTSDDHLSSGTLTLDGGTLSNGTSSMTIDNAISLGAAGGTFNIGGGSGSTPVVLSGVISGSGTLTKSGQAILELSSSNSYTADTHVIEGTVIASHANALGTTAGGTAVSSGATVRVAGALTLAESFNIVGTGKTVSAVDYGALHLVSGSSSISGSIALAGDANVSAASGATLSLNGPVSGTSTLTKTDAGSLFLNNSGNSASHTGGTTVAAGTLAFASDANLGSGTLTLGGGTLAIMGATTVDNAISLTATSNLSTSANVTFSGAISGSGSLNKAGASSLTLSGTNNGSGGITVASGTLSVASDSNLPSASLTLAGGTLAVTGETTINNAILVAVNANVQITAATTFSGSISGPGGLTKTGFSTLTLTGANSYFGATIVSAGTLVNNSSSSVSSFIVQSGATLSGGGVGGGVIVQASGVLSPGPGDLAVNGNLSMASGSTLAMDINGATAGTGYDQILVTGTVDVTGATLAVNHSYTAVAGDAYAIIVNDASDAITGTFSGLAQGGSLTAGGNGTQLVASYAGGTGSNDFVLSLANEAPTVANAIPNQNATEDSAFNFQFAANTFADANSDPLTYTAQIAGGGSLPSWLSFDGVTRTFSGTPLNAHVGTVSIDVIANDGRGGTVTDTFNITIANTNDDPIVANVIPNQNATEDSVFSFQFAANTFSDPDVGDTLTYTAQLNGGGSLPSWLSFNAATRTFSGTPLNADVGTVSIDVIADDTNGGTVTDTFNITVANTNDAPTVANPIPNRDAMKGSAFNFQFALNTFNDQDVGDTLTYSAQLAGGGGLPAWLSFDPVTRTFSGTPDSGDLGTVSIDVTANDGNSGTVTDTFTITVKNSAPVVTSVDTLTEDGAYKAGDTVLVVVTFDQPVTYTGTPQLTLETGATDRVLNVTNGLPGNSIYFSYLIGAGETSADLDYVSTTALGLNGGSIRNSEDTVANIILPAPGTAGSLGANANIVIDTTAPVITSVVFTPGNYVQGNQIQVAVTFSEAVEVLNPDTPTTAVYGLTLTPDHGDDFAAATYLTPIGNTMALIATVPAGVADADGITPGTELVGGPPLADAAGNLLVLTLNNISGASGVLVDSIAPVVSTPIPDQPLVIGDAPVTIDLTQHFTDIGISPMVFVVLNNSDNTKASASITGNTLTLTGLANGVTDITIRADDNYGGFVVDTFQAAVGTSEPTAVQPVLSGTLNPQNGLFELTVNVTNTTPLPINGMRLHLDFSAYLAQHPSLRLYNATATTAPGIAHVDHPFPVAMNAVVPVKLSFYTTTRQFPEPFAPVLTVETLASSALPDTNGSGVQPRLVEMPDGNKLIEFPTEAGKWYRVRYSQDMVNWYDSPVPLQAGANRMQWIDSGPPFTQSPPSSVPSRFYIVNEITAP